MTADGEREANRAGRLHRTCHRRVDVLQVGARVVAVLPYGGEARPSRGGVAADGERAVALVAQVRERRLVVRPVEAVAGGPGKRRPRLEEGGVLGGAGDLVPADLHRVVAL